MTSVSDSLRLLYETAAVSLHFGYMVNSRVLRQLRGGELVRVAGMSRVRDPWLAEVIGRTGYDVIWFDMEHRAFGYEVIDPIATACRLAQIDLMVRVLKTGYTAPMRAMEFGANGIMVPHILSAAEARQWAEWTRFPPLGRRGFDGAGADADYLFADPVEYMQHANRETFLVLQIEDREAVECVDEIAAVEGVDLLFIGPGDLSISLGHPFQVNHSSMQKAIDRVAEAAAKHGKWWGMPTGSPQSAQGLIDRGARFVVCGGDHGALVNGLREGIESHKGLHIPA
jgi:4-hydroxy-2-oxoheptanedioate aldolase